MRVVEPGEARGSLKWIRRAVNEHADLLDHAIVSACPARCGPRIDWTSPLESDDYAEYRDQDFLDLLGVRPASAPLAAFWPNFGPQWDALGRLESGEIVLVEAKANVPEMVSPGTGAGDVSRRLIERSLNETQSFLGVDTTIPWTGKLYQYANRLAHLYYLRELNALPTYLAFVYFTGDTDVGGPETTAEWKSAIIVAEKVLGLGKRHPLSNYVVKVFIDVNRLRGTA